MIRWLTAAGVDRYVAYIHPNHAASAAVARRQGLCPTDVIEDSEVRWQSLDDRYWPVPYADRLRYSRRVSASWTLT